MQREKNWSSCILDIWYKKEVCATSLQRMEECRREEVGFGGVTVDR
jgi:hypothetical protein